MNSILQDFTNIHRISLKSNDISEYNNYLKNILFKKIHLNPKVLNSTQNRMKNLILLQLESYPKEFINSKISPYLHNLSKYYEYIAPIESQPYTTWSTGSIAVTQCGIPQILPDIDWSVRKRIPLYYINNIKCISDILGTIGYKRVYSLKGSENTMGFNQWRESKKYQKVLQSNSDLEIAKYFADKFFPAMDKDVRENGDYAINYKGKTLENIQTNYIDFMSDFHLENFSKGNVPQFPSRYLLYILFEDSHIPYKKPHWCRLNFRGLKRAERCFKCDDFAASVIIKKYFELKMYEHSVLVVYPDHIPYGYHLEKNNHLFILFPGMEKIDSNLKLRDSISFYDFAPTVLDLIGVDNYIPEFPFGQSIYSLSYSNIMKHRKPDSHDLEIIYDFMNVVQFMKKININVVNKKFKCYVDRNKKKIIYSDTPCNFTI